MRKALAVAAALAALAALLAWAAPRLLDVRRYRSEIAAALSGTLGRAVTLGEVEATILGGVGFALREVAIAGTEAVPEPPIAAREVRARVAARPLLRRRVVVERLDIAEPELRFHRLGDGRTNWDGLAERLARLSPPTSGEGLRIVALAAPTRVAVRRVDVADGAFAFRDDRADARTALSHLQFRIRQPRAEAPAELRLAFDAEGGGRVEVEGTAGPFVAGAAPESAPLALDVGVRDAPLSLATAPGADGPRLAGGVANGRATVRGTLGEPAIVGEASVRGLSAETARGAVRLPKATATYDLLLRPAAGVAEVRGAQLRAGAALARAKGSIAREAGRPKLDLTLDLPETRIGDLIDLLPEHARPSAEVGGRVAFHGALAGDPAAPRLRGAWTFRDASIALGRARLAVAAGEAKGSFNVGPGGPEVAADFSISDATISAPPGSASGPIAGWFTAKGSPDALTLTGEADLGGLAISAPGRFEKPAGAPLTAAWSGALRAERAEVDRLRLALEGAALEASGEVALPKAEAVDLQLVARDADLSAAAARLPALAGRGVAGRAWLEARLTGNPSEPRTLRLEGTGRLAGVSFRPPQGPPVRALSGDLRLAGDAAEITGGALQAGGSRFAFSASARGLARPEVAFEATAPEVSPARWLPAEALGPPPVPGAGPDFLRDFRVAGAGRWGERGRPEGEARISASEARLGGVPMRGLKARGALKEDALEVERLRFDAYGGLWSASGRADLAGPAAPRWRARVAVSGLDMDPALTALAATPGVLFGRADLALSLSGAGPDRAAAARSLSGEGAFEMGEGRLAGSNVAAMAVNAWEAEVRRESILGPAAASVIAAIRGSAAFADLEEAESRFDRYWGDFTVAEERIRFGRLFMERGDWDIALRGASTFDQRLQFAGLLKLNERRLRAFFRENPALAALAAPLGDFEIPFALGGSFAKMETVLDPQQRFTDPDARRALTPEMNDALRALLRDRAAAERAR